MRLILGRWVREDEMEDYRREDAEDKMRARLEEMGRRGGPDAPEPCEECDGKGIISRRLEHRCEVNEECSRCLGTGVQP